MRQIQPADRGFTGPVACRVVTLSLTVDEPAWSAHVDRHLGSLGERLIPVVKGNGYGLGRRHLTEQVAGASPVIALGTVYETVDVVDVAQRVLVLTPTLDEHLDALAPNVTLTVGSVAQVQHLVDVGWRGEVVVKVASSMLRHGLAVERIATCSGLGELNVVAYAIHPPLVGEADDHRAEIMRLAARLPPAVEVHVSHLPVDEFLSLEATQADRAWKLRLGTALWHGDKSTLRLQADVLDVRRVEGGTTVGYRQVAVPGDGHVVVIGAGSAHGVVPLVDGRSPFHFSRRRLALIEGPHMHVSMVFVGDDDPCPRVGDLVDVQRPLISVTPDRVVWTT